MIGKTHTYKVKGNNQDVICYPQLNYKTYRHVRWEKEERKLRVKNSYRRNLSVHFINAIRINTYFLGDGWPELFV